MISKLSNISEYKFIDLMNHQQIFVISPYIPTDCKLGNSSLMHSFDKTEMKSSNNNDMGYARKNHHSHDSFMMIPMFHL